MAESLMQTMLASSHLSGGNADYLENLYELYLVDPEQLPGEWRRYFAQLHPLNGNQPEVSHHAIRSALKQAVSVRPYSQVPAGGATHHAVKNQAHVLQLIDAYRSLGHHQAKLDPLGQATRHTISELTLEAHHLTEANLDEIYSSESYLTENGASLREILHRLQRTYSDTLGVEYLHISNREQVAWLQQKIETVQAHPECSLEQQQRILQHLSAAEGLEKYLASKYVGQKRFSLEGGESLVPMLHEMIQTAGAKGVKEIVIGMAHRGRLNVLINVLGKSPEELFAEFEGKSSSELSGDVKYHLGFSSNVNSAGGPVHLALAFNPSHLEIIGPVVEGSVRARLRRREDLRDKQQVVPLLIHGDAAFAGQGVVMETMNFSQARGFATGGTVHIVVNNQIGFTTSNPLDARSTLYCTDIAKMVQAPILHVNGDDPEMVVFVAKLAMEFRNRFKKDIVIDLVCYRRHGHNEADEPAITQPQMYQAIRALPSTRQQYADKLLKANLIDTKLPKQFLDDYRDTLDQGKSYVKTLNEPADERFVLDWRPYLNQHWRQPIKTNVPLETLQKLSDIINTFPQGFTPHTVVKRLYQERQKMTAGELPLNWGYAEMMAYATLCAEGTPVRLSGQDSGRGTFAHRHAVIYDVKTNEVIVPLQKISEKRDQVIIIDSILSEEAVLGFEYGYAAADPNVLVLWEAQFGDFVNGAQVVIDQFISSGEQKWGRLCGLVMLLPHGYEGQGPEHSSARLERFLQLCAEHNMQVCVPSTPAQMFHMLRRQILRHYRKPLIVMTPKSLLRHKLAVSQLRDLTDGQFHCVIPEIDDIPVKQVKHVVLCAGKVYYDLLERRREKQQTDVAIVRIEQLYPFPKDELSLILENYKHVKRVVWCQEEPQNQGAWYPSKHHMENCLTRSQRLHYVGRGFFAAPAVGHMSLHLRQQKELVEAALRTEDSTKTKETTT